MERVRITRPDPVIAAATAVALGLRLFRLDRAALWFDETYTASWLALPWPDAMRDVLGANHLPLYFAVTKAWVAAFGSSPWVLRLPSAFASAATVPVVAAIARLASGRDAARRAAWLAAILPFALHHAQEARMYSFVGLLAAATTLGLLRTLSEDRPAAPFLLAVAGVALATTHYYGTVFVGVVLVLLSSSSTGRARGSAALAPLAITVALALAAAWHFGRPEEAGARYDLGPAVVPGLVWAMVGGCTLVPQPAAAHALGARAALPYLGLAVPGLSAAAWLAISARGAMHPRAWRALAVLLGAAITAPLAAAFLAGVGSSPRYASAGFPALVALLGAGMSFSRSSPLRCAAALVVAGCALAGTVLHLADPGHGREDVVAAGAWLDAHGPPGDAPILVTSEEMVTLARFHWPARKTISYPPLDVVARARDAHVLAAATPFPAGDRVFYVFGRDWLSDPDGVLRAAVESRFPSCGSVRFAGIRILCLRRAPGAGSVPAAAPEVGPPVTPRG